MNKVVTNEKVMAGGDFNDHVGSDMDRVFQIPNSAKGWRADEFHPLPQWGKTRNFTERGIFCTLPGGENLRTSDLQFEQHSVIQEQ